MTANTELKKYFKNRIDVIEALVEKSGHLYSTDYFHQLRVEIKKINSLFELLNFSSKKFKRKLFFKPYKIIFKKAGRIREFQLEEATLKKYVSKKALINFKDKIKKQLLEELGEFNVIKNRVNFRKNIKLYKRIIPFMQKAGKRKTISYLKKKQERIGKLLLKKSLKTDEVHKLRKHLKKYYYNLKSLKFPGQQKQLREIVTLQDLLGKWHDCIVIKRHLENSIISNAIKLNEKKQIENIIEKINVECNYLFGKINIERKILSAIFHSK